MASFAHEVVQIMLKHFDEQEQNARERVSVYIKFQIVHVNGLLEAPQRYELVRVTRGTKHGRACWCVWLNASGVHPTIVAFANRKSAIETAVKRPEEHLLNRQANFAVVYLAATAPDDNETPVSFWRHTVDGSGLHSTFTGDDFRKMRSAVGDALDVLEGVIDASVGGGEVVGTQVATIL